MSDSLRQHLAPISDEGWKEINTQATRTIKGNLSARKLVDFSGPHGWDYGAVTLGSLKKIANPIDKASLAYIREVRALVEVQVPFKVNIVELDNITRGGKAPDLADMLSAAQRIALIEESAVYGGFPAASITGMAECGGHKALHIGLKASDYPETFEQAILALQKSSIGGPFAIVLGTEPYRLLMAGDPDSYPVRKKVEALAKGGIHWSPAIDGGMVISQRGGDFELTIGQDYCIGYKAHDEEAVELYFTESFTFRVLEPKACIELKLKK